MKIQRKKAVDVRIRTTALYELIAKKGIQGRLAVFEERFRREHNQVLAKEYHQIYGILMDLLDKLVDLLGEEELTIREYTEILEAGFAEVRVGVIPPGVDQVMAGDMERTRLKDVKVLFFLGVNEGSVPKNMVPGRSVIGYGAGTASDIRYGAGSDGPGAGLYSAVLSVSESDEAIGPALSFLYAAGQRAARRFVRPI